MDCKSIGGLLAAYLDGEVTPEERKQIEAHLPDCPQCHEELKALTATRDKLRQALKEMAAQATPPAWSWDRIKQRAGIKDRVERPVLKRRSPALITVPLSIFLLAVLIGTLFAGMGGMALPPPEPPSLVADGSGGAFVFWLEEPSKYGDGIYVQHVDATGSPLWGEKGRLLASEYDVYSGVPLAVSDGAGGAIVAWGDGDGIYAQRLDSEGDSVWGNEKVFVWSEPVGGWQGLIGMTTDGSGGAILLRETSSETVYAQRVSAEGVTLWEGSGTNIGRIQYAYMGMPIVSDGDGGAVIVWEDDSGEGNTLYAQRINNDGELLWAEGGVSVTSSVGERESPRLISDGTGSFIIAWTDISVTEGWDKNVYAQKLDANGNRLWGERGILVYDNPQDQSDPQLAADGSGGCVVAWRDSRKDSSSGLFAQRVSPAGEPLWQDGGVPLWDIPEGSPRPGIGDIYITSGDASSSLVAWVGRKNLNKAWPRSQVYVQRLGPDGQRLWSETGVEVYRNPPFRTIGYSSVISDGSGGFIIGSRVSEGSNMSRTDSVYMQRLDSAGRRPWGEGGVEIQLKHSSPLLPAIATVVVLITVLILFGVFRGNRLAGIFTAIAPVIVGITALFCFLLFIGPFAYSYGWAYILDTPADLVSVAIIPLAGLAIGAVGIWRRTVTRWATIPVVVFCVLVVFIVESIIIAGFF
jgi:hypothetical protein